MAKATAARKHEKALCDCYDSQPQELKRCPYQLFPDGWSYTPHVNLGHVRGEIFTPRWLVERTLTRAGLISSQAAFGGLYGQESELALIEKRVIEPGLGTGNFLVTLLHHRLKHCAARASSQAGLDLPLYENLMLKAVASLYGYDLSVGNVEIARRRLLSQASSMNEGRTIAFWSARIENQYACKLDLKEKEWLEVQVKNSLREASDNWCGQLREGLLNQHYFKVAKKPISEELRGKLQLVINANLKSFDGLQSEPVKATDGAWPGYDKIFWTWWTVQSANALLSESHPMRSMMNS